MISAERKPESKFKGPITVAYILIVLGVALIPVGIMLTLIRDCTTSACEFL